VGATELDRWTDDGIHGASGPAWSPDGSRLAYVRNGRIVVVAADGADGRELPPVRIEPAPGDDAVNWEIDGTWWPGGLSWSPDGRRLLSLGTDTPFLDRGVRSSLVTVDADGSGEPIVLTRWRLAYYGTREPAWQRIEPSGSAWDIDAAGVDDRSPLERTGPPLPTPTPTPPPRPVPQPE
jgi:Tol biopolymer transport system component